jgi:cytochrome c-type biogenesis protein
VSSCASGPGDPDEVEGRLWAHPAFLSTLVVSSLVVLAMGYWQHAIETALFDVEWSLGNLLPAEQLDHVGLLLLPVLGFGSGLLASVSPCILPLVPLNVAYIGAAGCSGLRSIGLSIRFVIGSALALSLLGLFGDLAGFLMVDHRGTMLLIAGVAMLYFGLAILELVPTPTGRPFGASGRALGPIGAGAAFSLITTPCSSPLLAALLTISAAQAIAGAGVVAMLSFSLGYTMLVFLGGIFGGGLFAWIRRFDLRAPRAAAAALLIACGITIGYAGADWF